VHPRESGQTEAEVLLDNRVDHKGFRALQIVIAKGWM